MQNEQLALRWRASLRAMSSALAAGAQGGRVEDLGDGVTATVMPARPERSLFNPVSFLPGRAGALIERLDAVRALYDEAGIQAWAVWVHDEPELVAALRGAGLVQDSVPPLMAAPIDELDLERRTAAELVRDRLDLVAAVNDRGWEVPAGFFAPCLAGAGEHGVRAVVALVDGAPVAGVATVDHGGDCYIAFVATDPDHRRRGLGGDVLRVALADARERGMTTTTLEASPMGHSVYAAMGYRELGAAELWEHRVTPAV